MKKWCVLLLFYMSPTLGSYIIGPDAYRTLVVFQLSQVSQKNARINTALQMLSNSLLRGLNMRMLNADFVRALVERVQEEMDEQQILLNRLRKLLPREQGGSSSFLTEELFPKKMK